MAAVEETGPRKDGRGDDGEAAADPTWSGRLKESSLRATIVTFTQSLPHHLVGPFHTGFGRRVNTVR